MQLKRLISARPPTASASALHPPPQSKLKPPSSASRLQSANKNRRSKSGLPPVFVIPLVQPWQLEEPTTMTQNKSQQMSYIYATRMKSALSRAELSGEMREA